MLPNGGNLPPLSMSDINGPNGFNGRGNNLNAYRGTLFYRPDNSTGYFTSGAISFTDFFATGGSSPVVAGNSGDITSGSTITLPVMFNKLYVTCYGGSGGGGQGAKGTGYASTYGGNGGGNGSATIFMSGTAFAVSADYGRGGGGGQSSGNIYGRTTDGTGANGTDGTGAGGLAGGAGGGGAGTFWSGYYYTEGAGGGGGGAGGKTGPTLVMDIDVMGWSNIRNYYNAVVGITIGSGGTGGNGATGGGNNGTGGSSGKIYISWT